MSTAYQPPAVRHSDGHRDERSVLDVERADWQARTRVVLRPTAAPSILGFYAFAIACSAVAAHIAGWFGPATVASTEWVVALVGGAVQLLAAGVAFRARDGVATAIHGAWGSFWLGYGLLWLLDSAGAIGTPLTPTHVSQFGLWLIVVGAISLVAALAAFAEQAVLGGTLLVLATGAGVLGAAEIVDDLTLARAGAWILLGGSALAFYVASALLLATSSIGPRVLPLGRMREPSDADGDAVVPLGFELGEPGVRRGQ